MNDTTVAIICVALVASPGGYALGRLYRECASTEAGRATTPAVKLDAFRAHLFAEPILPRPRARVGDTAHRPSHDLRTAASAS
jgi:hypothetical protein